MTHFKRGAGLLLALALVLGLQTAAFAQTGAASITGLVTDQSGAATPGVTVTATNQATNVDYTAVSNTSGNYTITTAPIGIYVVKAGLTGFKTTTFTGVALEAKQISRIDFKLEVGALEDTIEVVGQSPVLQTESATVGEVLSGKTVTALPLNGRNTGQLSLLLPGVVTPNPASFTNANRAFSGGRPFVNGNREQTNNYTIDGVDMNESIDNLVAYQPSPDALAEISVETNNYSADTGNVAGAVISNVFKSGANEFHGNAFEFYRNSDFDANSWSNNRSGAARPERKQHIFGATLGGPIIKNKLFFFVDYQGTKFDAPGTEALAVAPEAWRRGDLSSVTTQIRDPLTGQPFPGNQIPLNRISPNALAILNDVANYPLPNRTVTGVAGNYVGETLTTTRAHQGDARLDWNASNADKLFARFSYATYDSKTEKRAMPLALGSRNTGPFKNLAFNWSHVFGASLINEVLLGYNEVAFISETADWAGIGAANAKYGIPGGQPIPGLSSIGFGGGLTSPGAGAADSDTLDKVYQLNEKLTWLKGNHALKFGGQFLHYNQRRYYAGNNGLLGIFGYSATYTGFQFSDFLLDRVGSKGRGGGDPNNPWTHLHNRIALFVQDDFKVRPDLTLNLGLRWAYTAPLVEKDNRQANLNLTTGQMIPATDGSLEDRALYKPYYKGFEPRLGFAWSASDRLVFRGGYGISQLMEGTGANLRLPQNPPFFFESNVGYDSTTGAGTLTTGFADLVATDKPAGIVRSFAEDLRPQFTHQWNVFAEYQLTPSMSGQIGYVGHNATKLVTPIEANQALPGVGNPTTWTSVQTRRPLYAVQPLITNVPLTAPGGKSNYNSLQASVRQREWHGLEFLASYTFAKGLTNNLGYYGSGGVAAQGAYWMNAYDPQADYGPAFFDIRHNFVFSGNYELPFGKGRHWGSDWSGITEGILGGWRVSGIFQARTGFPITVTDGRNTSQQGGRGPERPMCIGNPVPSNQGVTSDPNAPNDSKWLDITAFTRAALGTFGDCGVGIATAPGYTNVDLVLAKRFSLGGTRALEFRAEAFNVLNHPSWSPPGRNVADATTFGIITGTVSTARVMELVLKLYF